MNQHQLRLLAEHHALQESFPVLLLTDPKETYRQISAMRQRCFDASLYHLAQLWLDYEPEVLLRISNIVESIEVTPIPTATTEPMVEPTAEPMAEPAFCLDAEEILLETEQVQPEQVLAAPETAKYEKILCTANKSKASRKKASTSTITEL